VVGQRRQRNHGVAVQVEFERKQILETRKALDGCNGLKPGAFRLWGNWILTCTAPPRCHRHRPLLQSPPPPPPPPPTQPPAQPPPPPPPPPHPLRRLRLGSRRSRQRDPRLPPPPLPPLPPLLRGRYHRAEPACARTSAPQLPGGSAKTTHHVETVNIQRGQIKIDLKHQTYKTRFTTRTAALRGHRGHRASPPPCAPRQPART
jgi:hypothetical protein